MTTPLFLLGHLWALPNTLLGLLVVLIGKTRFSRREGGALVFGASDGGACAKFFQAFKMGAFALGAVVVMQPALLSDGRLLRHELRHFTQAKLLGPLFLPAYGLCSLWAVARGGHAYFNNALERDARAAEAA